MEETIIAKVNCREMVIHPGQPVPKIEKMENKPDTLTPDEDYRDPDGCGCVISIALVIVIFAIAAGLWLFSRS
jgi:hypothetical protein